VSPNREALIRLREVQNLTRAEIAAHYSVSVATVRRWIRDMDIPRPARRSPRRDRKPDPAPVPDMAGPGDGYTALEQARIVLGPRVLERRGYGYYLDGTPSSAERIIATAGIKSKPVR
jgi:hypothetical protein